MRNVRRSGRTWAACKSALLQVQRGRAIDVRVVVWHSGMIPFVEQYLREITRKENCEWKHSYVRVVAYGAHSRNAGSDTVYVYDHYVHEQLEFERTGQRRTECVRAVLNINGWTREEVVDMRVLGGMPYRIAVHEPMCSFFPGTHNKSDTVEFKTVNFVWKNEYNSDGLAVLEMV